MKVLIKVEIDENRQWAEANKLYDLLKNYKPVLMPMPERKPVLYDDEIFGEVTNLTNIGYNSCLDDILGETE